MATQDDMVNQAKGVNSNLGALIKAVLQVFPNITGTSSTATGGAATLPSNPVGFISVTLPNGTSVKIPYYAS